MNNKRKMKKKKKETWHGKLKARAEDMGQNWAPAHEAHNHEKPVVHL
jgi:hypothetical protein